MTNLERHILKLLLDNDCVIVPGFGGFIAHHIPASYDEKSNTFMPPYRTVGFNSKLVMNDSILAQEYACCYDISYPEALKRIEYEAEEFERTIEQAEGGYEIFGIGRIYKLSDGSFDFLPNASGLTTPDLYGFAPFEIAVRQEDNEAVKPCMTMPEQNVVRQAQTAQIKPLNAEKVPMQEQSTLQPNSAMSDNGNERRVSVSIPLNVLHQIAAACIVLFILIAIPSKLGDASTSNMRKSAINTNWLYDIMPKDITTGKPQSLTPIEHTKEDKSAGNHDDAVVTKSDRHGTRYTIVLASRVAVSNATAYAERLRKEGMSGTGVYTKNGMTMVVYNTFDSKEKAKAELNRINKNPDFANCWITEIK